MSETASAWSVRQVAELACIIEATAPKAGNVHPGASFADMGWFDFVASAVAVAPVFDAAATRGIGATILAAVRRRCEVTPVNTNLGILLLLAPLAAVPRDMPLRAGLRDVLEGLTVADARDTYEAIRLAAPGGLGQADAQDVAGTPTETLLEVMRRAADRDLVARQYAATYADVFDAALPALRDARQAGLPIEAAVVGGHLHVLARIPDTLIVRKRGLPEAREASRRAAAVLTAGWPDAGAQPAFDAFDAWLRADGNARNPGATADLVAAALFAGLREGIITLGPGNRGQAEA